jgi:hypothetical protein
MLYILKRDLTQDEADALAIQLGEVLSGKERNKLWDFLLEKDKFIHRNPKLKVQATLEFVQKTLNESIEWSQS